MYVCSVQTRLTELEREKEVANGIKEQREAAKTSAEEQERILLDAYQVPGSGGSPDNSAHSGPFLVSWELFGACAAKFIWCCQFLPVSKDSQGSYFMLLRESRALNVANWQGCMASPPLFLFEGISGF